MLAHVLAAALALALAQTDQTVAVQKGTRLDISNFAGEVVIRTWDRDAVRVEVEHSDRESVDIRPGDQRLIIRGRSRTGNARSRLRQSTGRIWSCWICGCRTCTAMTCAGNCGSSINRGTRRS